MRAERRITVWERVRPVRNRKSYWVSELGRVYKLRDGKLWPMKLQTNPDGYLRVTLWPTGAKKSNHYVHRLVLAAFAGPCPPGCEGCHGPGGQKDNRLKNLRWDTPKANAADKKRFGAARKIVHVNKKVK